MKSLDPTGSKPDPVLRLIKQLKDGVRVSLPQNTPEPYRTDADFLQRTHLPGLGYAAINNDKRLPSQPSAVEPFVL